MSETAVVDATPVTEAPHIDIPQVPAVEAVQDSEQTQTPEKEARVSRLGRILGRESVKAAGVEMPEEAKKVSRMRRIGRSVLAALKIEGVGLGVDGLLIGAGLHNIGLRELLAAPVDVIMFKLFGKEQQQRQEAHEGTRNQKVMHLGKEMLAGVVVAVTAAKLGSEMAGHISQGLHEGVAGGGIVLGSKLAGLTAFEKSKHKYQERKSQKAEAVEQVSTDVEPAQMPAVSMAA